MRDRSNSQGSIVVERAIVTGGTSGIGRAIVLRLARRGAKVCIVGRNREAGRDLVEEVEAGGGEAMFEIADVSRADEVEKAVAAGVDRFGGIETAVSSAGIAVTGTVTDCSLEDWDRVLATNVSGAFYLARYALPELLRSHGTFTAISSDAGIFGACDFAAYITSKHALNGLMKSLALDYGKYGVRCNTVCPSFVETPMADQLLEELSQEEVEHFRSSVPLGRFARAEEVADAVAHLTSAEASYVNGLEYRLDGGATIGYFQPS